MRTNLFHDDRNHRRPPHFFVPLAVAILALFAAPSAFAAVPEHAAPSCIAVLGDAAGSIPRMETAKAQLEHAAGLKKAVTGTEGEERERARKMAIEGYRCVREYFGKDAPACSEAAFRAGELLRAADDMLGAQSEFVIARDRGEGTTFLVRAMLEIAHIDRRAKRLEKALDGYEAVVREEASTVRQKDDAMLWSGRVYADMERPKDARRTWQRVADKGDDPLDRVKAWDMIASLLVDQGDLEGAAGILERCREALSDVSQEESKLGERVRSALSSMRSQEELARAVEKRKHDGDASKEKKEKRDKPDKGDKNDKNDKTDKPDKKQEKGDS